MSTDELERSVEQVDRSLPVRDQHALDAEALQQLDLQLGSGIGDRLQHVWRDCLRVLGDRIAAISGGVVRTQESAKSSCVPQINVLPESIPT